MRRLKDMLTAVALVALCGVSLSAGYRVLRCKLPERDPYDLRELWGLLAGEDVSTFHLKSQRKLVERLDGELSGGTSVRDKFRDVARDAARSECLENNLETLARLWLIDQAVEYDQLEASAGDNRAQVDVFLGQQVAKVGRWLAIAGGGGGGDFNNLMASVEWMGRTETWLADETPERREKVERFLAALASRFMMR